MHKAVEYMKAFGTLNEDLLKNIAPLGWKHVNFLGEYTFDVRNVPELDDLRPLNLGNREL